MRHRSLNDSRCRLGSETELRREVNMGESLVLEACRNGKPQMATIFLAVDVHGSSSVDIMLDDKLAVKGLGLDLFDALVDARRSLEAAGAMIACNGARRDVYPSEMLRQSTGGRRAYVLSDRRGPQTSVDIFEPADWSSIASVDEQREEFLRWVGNPPKDYVVKWTGSGGC